MSRTGITLAALAALAVLASALLFSGCAGADLPPDETQTEQTAAQDTSGAEEETNAPEPDYGFPSPYGFSLNCTVPMPRNGSAYVFGSDVRDGAVVYAEDYFCLFPGSGYYQIDRREYGRFVFLVQQTGEYQLHLTFDKTARTLRIIKDKAERSVYSLNDETDYVGSASVIQLGNDHTSSDVGMGYIICLRDGSFAIVDGGHNLDSDADLIYNTLISKTGGDKPRIALWILTHAHSDHVGAFIRFSEKYAQSVTLGALVTADAVKYTPVNNEHQYLCDMYAANYDGAAVLTPQTGNKIKVGGVEFEFLYTYTDHYPQAPSCLNNTSIVLRVTARQGKSLLLLGDLQTEGAAFLSGMYGSRLKSDIVQFAHHGYRNGASSDVYGFVDAEYGFWPASESLYQKYKDTGPAGEAAAKMKKVYVAADGNAELSLE